MLIDFNYVLIYGSTNVFVLFHLGEGEGGDNHARVCATITCLVVHLCYFILFIVTSRCSVEESAFHFIGCDPWRTNARVLPVGPGGAHSLLLRGLGTPG